MGEMPHVVLLLLVVVVVVVTGCMKDADCQLLGTCQGGVCKCTKGFRGEDCSALNFGPAVDETAKVWPAAEAKNVSAWGFTTIMADGRYYAVVDVACGERGVLASGGGNSFLAILESDHPDRGYSLTSMLSVPISFGPHMVHDKDDGYTLIFRVNAIPDHPLICGGNQSGETPTLVKTASIKPPLIHPATGPVNMYVASAPTPAGPWGNVTAVSVSHEGTLHESNPSLWYLRPGTPAAKLGRVCMAFRFNGPKGEMIGVAYAPSVRGPYVAVANLTCHGCEDPFVWQTPSGSVHILFHNGPHGYHAYSADGEAWTVSEGYAYNLTVGFSSGAEVHFHRRERPELLLDMNGDPAYLFTGVETTSSPASAYTLVQPVV